MSLYASLDWKYNLPCADRMPAAVSRILHPWIRKAASLDGNHVRRLLQQRWRKVPRFLRPLRDRILEGAHPAVLGCQGRQWIETTLGAVHPDCDWPYLKKPWGTPSRFHVEKARKHLIGLRRREFSKKTVTEMSPDTVEFHAYHEWADGRHPVNLVENDYEEGEVWAVYVAPPVEKTAIDSHLRRVGLRSSRPVREFLAHFDNLRESPPRLAGGFIPVTEWRTVKADSEIRKYTWFGLRATPEDRARWGEAVIIFHAQNGDQIFLHPEGSVAWQVLPEHLVRTQWNDFEGFIQDYATAVDIRWPFDSYGPSSKAVKARLERRSV